MHGRWKGDRIPRPLALAPSAAAFSLSPNFGPKRPKLSAPMADLASRAPASGSDTQGVCSEDEELVSIVGQAPPLLARRPRRQRVAAAGAALALGLVGIVAWRRVRAPCTEAAISEQTFDALLKEGCVVRVCVCARASCPRAQALVSYPSSLSPSLRVVDIVSRCPSSPPIGGSEATGLERKAKDESTWPLDSCNHIFSARRGQDMSSGEHASPLCFENPRSSRFRNVKEFPEKKQQMCSGLCRLGSAMRRHAGGADFRPNPCPETPFCNRLRRLLSVVVCRMPYIVRHSCRRLPLPPTLPVIVAVVVVQHRQGRQRSSSSPTYRSHHARSSGHRSSRGRFVLVFIFTLVVVARFIIDAPDPRLSIQTVGCSIQPCSCEAERTD